MFALVLISCQKDEPKLDENLAIYLDRFEFEADLRGEEINIQELDIDFELTNIQDFNVVGQCYHYSDDHRRVVIDQNYWDRIGDWIESI